MTDSQHDHDRPGIADMRTALAVTRVLLDTADLEAACEAAAAGAGCPVCVAVAGISHGLTLASAAAGDTGLMSEPVRLALLALVAETERELRAAGN